MCLGISIFNFSFAFLSARIRLRLLHQWFMNYEMITGFCAYQIGEAIVVMATAFALIHTRCLQAKSRRIEYLSLFPSGIFLLGILCAQTMMFNLIQGYSYSFISFFISFGLFILLFGGAWLFKHLLPRWEWRVELKALIVFAQMLIAMFSPMVISGLPMVNISTQTSLFNTVLLLFGMGVIAGTGYLITAYKQSKGTE